MRLLLFALAGVPFGIGLAVSGMTNPAKVLGFLDLFGVWDPSLAFVMGGALAVAGLGFALLPRLRRAPLLDSSFAAPAASPVTPRLLIGAALFGVGWGLGGLCPGPAIANLASGHVEILAFVAAMLVGMAIAQRGLGADRS